MLTFSRKTDYALIALTHLAHDRDGSSSAREIAAQYGMPLPLLMNVLKLLAQRGLTRSSRGSRGGYKLAVEPQAVSLNDVIRAVEGPVKLVQCAGPPVPDARRKASRGGCDLTSCCPVRSSIHRLQDRVVRFFSELTLADVLGHNNGERPAATAEGAGDIKT